MINTLFSPSEIKKLKSEIIKQKNRRNTNDQNSLNGLYCSISNIERKNKYRNN